MKEMEPLVAVSIVNYNNGKTIIKSIESVLNQSYVKLELYIVDNGSKDGSLKEIEKSINVWNQKRLDYLKNKEDYYPIKLIKNNQNVGF
jgi:glycosyltransferase involved in cell wall biosynthesis